MNDLELEVAFEMMCSALTRYGENRSAHCPLAPWTHRGGRDKNPSLTAKAGDPALFKCWACSTQGSVKKLTRLYGEYSGDHRAFDYVIELEGGKESLHMPSVKRGFGGHGRYTGAIGKQEIFRLITEEHVSKFLEEVPNYAFERGLTKEQVLKWEIGYDKAEKRMIFVVRDYLGKLRGVSGRDLTGVVKNKYKHYHGLKKEKVFYGEKFWDNSHKRVHIVEGFFDVLGLERRGLKNTFASMGTSLSFDHTKKIKDWFNEVLFFPDGDLAGLKFAEYEARRISFHLGKKVGIVGVKLNPNHKPRDNLLGQWQDSDYRFKSLDRFVNRDPAEYVSEDINEALSNVGCFVAGKDGINVVVENWLEW